MKNFQIDNTSEEINRLFTLVASSVKAICESKGASPQPIIDAKKQMDEFYNSVPEHTREHALRAIDWVYSTYHESEIMDDYLEKALEETLKN